MDGGTLFEAMRSEHRRLLGRIDALGGRITPDAALESGLLADVKALALEFRDHMSFEDEAVYATLFRLLPETAPHAAALRAERAELRGMLDALLALLDADPTDDRDEQIVVQASDFFDLLRIHVRKEEALVFGLAGHALSPAETPPRKGQPS